VSVDDIVNKGTGSWNLITDNVTNTGLSSLWANAVPDVPDWEKISKGKSASHTQPWQRRFGPKGPGDEYAIDVEWRLRWEYGSQYRGGGLFIRTFSTEVLKVEAKPGYQVTVGFQTGHPQNEGPKDWPSAIMGIQINAAVATSRWHKNEVWRWFLHANGTLEVG
jgi:hypothetical protein